MGRPVTFRRQRACQRGVARRCVVERFIPLLNDRPSIERLALY